LQVIFVTVDPERDTPAILKAYLANFDKQALGLSGSLDETAAAAKEFKVFFQKVRGRTEGSYTMDHTAGSYIIDPAGNIRLFVRHGSNTAWLVDDVKALLN
jgi:protein SCO1